jgi:hypothetical protein
VQSGGKVRFYLDFGLYFSFLLSQQYLEDGYEEYFPLTSDVHNAVPINRNRINYGITAGVGMEIKILPKASLTLGVSDFYGCCNIKKQPQFVNAGGIGLGFNTKTYDNSAIFHLGFSANIGKTKQ